MVGLPHVNKERGWIRAGYVQKSACERCGSLKRLVVHHKDRNPFNNTDFSNLETLCRVCHVKEHGAEIAESQRDPETNKRRGDSIRIAKKGKHYPRVSECVRAMWAGPVGDRLREIRASPETSAKHSLRMTQLMNNPEHMDKRRRMAQQRLASGVVIIRGEKGPRCRELLLQGLSDKEIRSILKAEFSGRQISMTFVPRARANLILGGLL